MIDPFAHGTPAGDDHSWVRLEPPPCPTCKCCTAQLCERASRRGLPCDVIGRVGPDVHSLSTCPCSAPAVVRLRLDLATQKDPSNPDNHHATADHEALYNQRNGSLIAAARYAIIAGWVAGIIRDPAAPGWPVLVIVLPTGQVTWHLSRMGDHPDATHYYVAGCGLPLLAGVVWDGSDTAEKYRRVAAFTDA